MKVQATDEVNRFGANLGSIMMILKVHLWLGRPRSQCEILPAN